MLPTPHGARRPRSSTRTRGTGTEVKAPESAGPPAGGEPPDEPGGLRGRVIERLEASGRYPTWVLLAGLAGMFTTTFPITILTVALGRIAEEFEAPVTTVAWVISAPMLLSAVALPLLGKLGDLRGHRRVFLAGYAGATVTAVLSALAWDPGSLIGFRTLAAVLGGATQPTSMALILSVYPRDQRVRAMGWWSMTAAAAPALGLIAGGPLVDLLGWRIVFVLQAGFSLVTLVLAGLVLRETPGQRVRFDVAGALSLALGVGGFMFGLGRVREVGLASVELGVAAVACVLGLALFVRIEREAPAPLLPLVFFRVRNFTAPLVSNAFMGAAYMGAFVLAPLVLIELFGFSLSAASAFLLLRTLSLTAASPLGAWLGGRVGERGAAVIGAGVMTVSLGVIVLALRELSLPLLGLGFVLQGTGHGLGLPSLTSSIANAVDEANLGIASAANRLTAQAGSAFGITLLTLVYGGLNVSEGFARAYLVGAGLSALSLLAAALMRAHRGHAERGEPVFGAAPEPEPRR